MSRVAFIVAFLFVHFVATAQPYGTVQDGMKAISDRYGVYFVYEASLPVTHSFPGQSLKGKHLKDALDTLFENTGIKWLRKGKYILLKASIEDQLSPSIDSFQLDTLPAASISEINKLDINNTQAGLTTIDGDKFKSAFACLSSPDVLKTLQSLPGVATGTEMLSRLYVHGGDGSDNLFLMDGVPLHQISHLCGIFSSFNTEVISSIDFYKSGFPARFGGRTSSIVDIKTNDGCFTRFKGLISIGLLEGRIQVEGPIILGKTSFNMALRRSLAESIMIPISLINNTRIDASGRVETASSLYSFTDFTAKVTHKISNDNRISASFIIGNDNLSRKNNSKSEDKEDPITYTLNEKNLLRMKWGNIMASLNWQKEWSPQLNMSIIAYWSANRSLISYLFEEEGLSSCYGIEEAFAHIRRVNNHNTLDDIGVSADFSWDILDSHRLRFGGSFIRHYYNPYYDDYEFNENTGIKLIDISKRDSVTALGFEADLYLEDEFTITPKLKANMGFRNSVYTATYCSWDFFEPRLAINLECNDIINVNMSYATMSQFSHQVASTYLDIPTNCWLPSNKNLPPMNSHQFAVGVHTQPLKCVHFYLDGWYKTMNNLVEYYGENSLFPRLSGLSSTIFLGKGRSYGIEMDFGYEMPSLMITAFYTRSWNERFFSEIYKYWYRDRNDNRHKLTIQGDWRINKKWELFAAWHFHSGNRMTLPTQYLQGVYAVGEKGMNSFYHQWIYEMPNNVKMPDYHRLDIGVNIHGTTKKGNRYVWNLSVYNAYCHLNPIYAEVVRDGISHTHPDFEPGYVAFKGIGTGLVPLIPSFSYTLMLGK